MLCVTVSDRIRIQYLWNLKANLYHFTMAAKDTTDDDILSNNVNNIFQLYLDDNNLSELPVDLIPWDKVEVLGMTGNEWLCNCDLANIVINKKAGQKFKAGEIP